MKVRTDITQVFMVMLLFVVLLLCPIALAEEALADEKDLQGCNSTCGCDEMYIYDPVGDRCLVNFKKVVKRVVVLYNKQHADVTAVDGMAKSIYVEGEKIFRGILISVLLFMVCAGICIVTACIYCCRINYTDRTLKNDVKALAKKLKRDYNSRKMAPKRAPLPQMSESCNVVVETAGIYVA